MKTFTQIREWAEARNLIASSIGDCVVVLTILAAQNGLQIEDCIAQAYDEIKDRRMAANKRPRKKYSPKRNPIAAYRYAHFVPKLAVSNEPLKDEEIVGISAPYFAFIEALKAGTATEGMFYAACRTHYLYFALLKVFQADTFNADEDTEAAFRIGFALQVEDASGKVAETIDTIGKRYTERGKFIATGDELRLLQQTADRFKAALEMAAWKHYVRAIQESEPVLDAEARRKRKNRQRKGNM